MLRFVEKMNLIAFNPRTHMECDTCHDSKNYE
ncbi:hypothetical protein DJ90_4791 [Paenibacillus macerans]|uniref:Uncharacterized protein n=1 Tax=Paenibacillus macerans TaxID=44252 RepID=A0A090YMT2_PAEMA|nr:hypothetical protein DJ90_4791 [Paenibacillus macerans]